MPERKLAIPRDFLPILRMVSDEGRLSILEIVTYSPEQPVRTTRVMDEIKMSPSSFFKFTAELTLHNLVAQPSRGFVESTEFGTSTLEMLTSMNERFNDMRIALLRANYKRLGFSPEEIDIEFDRFKKIVEAKRTGAPYTL